MAAEVVQKVVAWDEIHQGVGPLVEGPVGGSVVVVHVYQTHGKLHTKVA